MQSGPPTITTSGFWGLAFLASLTIRSAPAEATGFASSAMSGFDAQGVAQAFGLAAHEVPVMLIPVGRAAAGNWPQKPRRALAEVLELT